MKQLKLVAAGISIVVAAFAATSAQAAVMFQSAVYNNIANPAVNAWCSSCGGSYKVFDQFTLGSAGDIGAVDFAIQSNYGSNWNIQLQIWAADRATQLYNHVFGSADYTIAYAGNNVNKMTVDLAGFNLNAGTYWMSWYDGANMGVPGYNNAGGVLYQDPNNPHSGQSAAFRISGNEVPEPGSLALFGIAALLGVAAKRRKKAAV